MPFHRIPRIAFLSVIIVAATARAEAPGPQQSTGDNAAAPLHFVRVFSSSDDVKHEHAVLSRTLDIVAGPADPASRVDTLKSPAAVAGDSSRRIFVADPGAGTVHVFDFARGKYSHLDSASSRLHDPVALAVDKHDNLYVVDQTGRTVFVYDSAGKYRRSLGQFRGGESYFESPSAIAIDGATGHLYICDRFSHIIFVMDQKGKVLRRIGKRGGGEGQGEFRFPSELALGGNELYVLDAGNKRIQVLDLAGHYLRSIAVGYAGHGAGLAVDAQHNIYITDPSLNQLQEFAPDGRLLRAIDVSTIPGAKLSSPSGVWMDALRLLVIDTQKNQVGEFEVAEGK